MQTTYTPIIQPNIPQPSNQQLFGQQEQNGFQSRIGQINQNGQIPNQFAGQQLQTNRFNAPNEQNQPILHAVPNVVDPLQRTHQLHNLPTQLEFREKWNEGKSQLPKIIFNLKRIFSNLQ
jgi:hypothetical protein